MEASVLSLLFLALSKYTCQSAVLSLARAEHNNDTTITSFTGIFSSVQIHHGRCIVGDNRKLY